MTEYFIRGKRFTEQPTSNEEEVNQYGRTSTEQYNMYEDWGVAGVWTKGDSEYIVRKFAKIRAQGQERKLKASRRDGLELMSGNKLADEWERNLLRIWNDQTVYDDMVNKYLEPLQIEKQNDLIVTSGLAKIAMLVTGESDHYFDHFASGKSTIPEARGDIQLRDENARVSLFNSGYQTSSGTSMKFSGFFPTGVPTAVITEGGVFDNFTGGNMLFRTVYTNSLSHIQYETVYTLTQVILTSSITKVV